MEHKLPPNTAEMQLVEKPILIELRQSDKALSGTFQPQAYLKLTPTLRTSGLLGALPAEEVKSLLFLLSFVSPNGDCSPTITQLSQAMGVSAVKVHTRMQRLTQFVWQGEPLAVFLRPESGLDSYMPHPKLIAYEHTAEPQAAARESPPVYRAAGGEAVRAHSQRHYARPRAEVERDIAQRMGWHQPAMEGTPAVASPAPPMTPEDNAVTQVRQQLERVGISAEQANALVQRFDLLRIQRQLSWLPYRKVRNPAGFLVAAIEDNYEAPLSLWHSHQERAAPSDAANG